MARIDDLFVVHRARSALFEAYKPGDTAYVSNTADSNGVLGFVTPRKADAVFRFTGIVLNSFSRSANSLGARVQTPPFVASSRSGNGLLVLEPRKRSTLRQLVGMAAYINHAHGWRFTWYRQATRDRVTGLPLPDVLPRWPAIPALDALIERRARGVIQDIEEFRDFVLDEVFELVPGDIHAVSHLGRGTVPVISCADERNGITGWYDVPPELRYSQGMTIAFNGRPLTAKYHHYEFAAKDDVAVALPRQPLRLTSLLFIKMMLDRERWRYSYYRKCYIDKLRRFSLRLPSVGGRLDEDAMEQAMHSSPYWPVMARQLGASAAA